MRPENRIQDAFGCIKAGEEMKSSTKDFLRKARLREEEGLQIQKTERKEKRRKEFGSHPALLRMAGAACAMLAMVLAAGGYILFRVPVSYVSIDINPSIELELNRLDRVICARAYNQDGEKVLEGVSVNGKYYTDAVETVVASDAMQPYLSENADITFTVASGDGQRKQLLITGIENCSGGAGYEGRIMEADMDMVEEAHANGFSLGKYDACRILQQYDPSVTLSDCHNMSMSEIHKMIDEHEGHDGHGNESHENESGHWEGSENGSHGNESGHWEGNENGSHGNESGHEDGSESGSHGNGYGYEESSENGSHGNGYEHGESSGGGNQGYGYEESSVGGSQENGYGGGQGHGNKGSHGHHGE